MMEEKTTFVCIDGCVWFSSNFLVQVSSCSEPWTKKAGRYLWRLWLRNMEARLQRQMLWIMLLQSKLSIKSIENHDCNHGVLLYIVPSPNAGTSSPAGLPPAKWNEVEVINVLLFCSLS
ncbi:hypothetical protein FEM48_Zijuj07G0041800 [Ziziphus jujuba var. spinosa]|uniref:Uncharacterized protein n=1 Tax=Ziziphus jujuba var. spinosa TaxID=714518 RepID=A0A978V2D3_ZIZJJ|nr:hypothetical protein FEM48_Zijuj07G0041800 [Ziziphus jujuba var. spinosa]